jgi:hypothetical protein
MRKLDCVASTPQFVEALVYALALRRIRDTAVGTGSESDVQAAPEQIGVEGNVSIRQQAAV